MIDEIWSNRTVYIKSMYGFTPELWGCVAFTNSARPKTLIEKTTNPFIMVAYVTTNSPTADKYTKGKIVGFYLLSHTEGHRSEFTHPSRATYEPQKWQHALKAVRAFSFLPEYRMDITTLLPDLKHRAQATGQWGEELSKENIEILRALPVVEASLYGGNPHIENKIIIPQSGLNKVRAGPVNRFGFWIDGEPADTEKELYALKLEGNKSSFLSGEATGLNIYKVGLSISPVNRLSCYRKSLPRTLPDGNITWDLHRSTRLDTDQAYPSFEAALAGEEAMKDYLGNNGTWLGGEFYAATEEVFEDAWEQGRNAASNYKNQQG